MIPQVSITRLDGQTGVVAPSAENVVAVIGPSSAGTLNSPAAHTRSANARSEFGEGGLTESAAYVMAVAKKPVVCVRGDSTTDGAYGSVVKIAGGTAAPTAGASKPFDDYSVVITFVTGGALGSAGITYKYSLDGGRTSSKVLALGTALTIAIPNSGVGFTLGTSTQTILAGQKLTCTTTGPIVTGTELDDALEALRTSTLPWECIYLTSPADEDDIIALDLFLSELEAAGKYRWAIVNARPKGAAESNAAYLAALAAIRAAAPTTRVIVCADGGYLVSPQNALRLFRPAALGVVARAMAIDIAIEPAYVADGPIAGFAITDDRGNPSAWNEALFPGADDLKFTTLRTFEKRAGCYITNTNVFSPEGSDYVYLPHVRVMNRACEIAFDILTVQLSSNVRKEPGKTTILNEDAEAIEALVNAAYNTQLRSRVGSVRFSLNRDDDLSSNAGAKLTGEIKLVALSIIKTFEVVSRFAIADSAA